MIAAALRDGGMEVIYSGLHQTPEAIVNAAVQEDVDAIGVSILSGAHMTILPLIHDLMKQKKLDDVLLTGGGIIPDDDAAELARLGIGRLFGPGTHSQEIIDYIKAEVGRRRRFTPE